MYSRILVPTDGSPTAERGVQEAIELARQTKSHLVLLYVLDNYPMMLEMASAVNFDESWRAMLRVGRDSGNFLQKVT